MSKSENNSKNLLYVDDEESNLDSFSLSLMEYYAIFTAKSANEGLKILEKETIHVLVTDQRMPGVTGLEFLKKVRLLYPDIVCIIVSGQSDIGVVIKALNEVGIYQYIEKPWDLEALKHIIDNAFEKYYLRQNNKALIGNLQRSNRKLESTNQQLENKVEQLDTYMYRASHDLRGYLTRFIGLCKTGEVEFKSQGASIQHYFKLLQYEAHNMNRILQNHLLLNLIEGKDTHLETVSLAKSITTVISLLKQQVENKDKLIISVTNHCLPHQKVETDSLLFDSILYQLLHNAWVFKKADAPIVLEVKSIGKQYLMLTITDKGIGIDKKFQQDIFNQFFRGSSASRGNGLGLYIVDIAIKKLGGSIKVNSNIGEGTTFTIKFPKAFLIA